MNIIFPFQSLATDTDPLPHIQPASQQRPLECVSALLRCRLIFSVFIPLPFNSSAHPPPPPPSIDSHYRSASVLGIRIVSRFMACLDVGRVHWLIQIVSWTTAIAGAAAILVNWNSTEWAINSLPPPPPGALSDKFRASSTSSSSISGHSARTGVGWSLRLHV